MNFKSLISNLENGFFIQIGSYDGISNDEFGLMSKLMHEKHTAILVEPIPQYFNMLLENYKQAHSHIYFENIAIGDKKEVKKIQINGQDSSFVRKFDNKLEMLDVQCEHFNYLVKKYNIVKVDALVIDTEAYELVIIESILKSNTIAIDIIRYEYIHLSIEDSNRLDSILESNGYFISQDETSYADKVAVKKKKLKYEN